MPFLTTYFSSSNPSYNNIVDTGAGSSYTASQTFNCQNSATSVNCPFPSGCPTTYQAQFNQQFCNSTFMGSAANLIAGEKATNSTTWLNNTVALATALSTMSTSPQNVNNLVSSVSNFTTSLASYETSIQNGFSQVNIYLLSLYQFKIMYKLHYMCFILLF